MTQTPYYEARLREPPGSAAARLPPERRSGNGHAQDDRPLSEVVSDLWEKTETLVRQEVKLGLTEAEERVTVLKSEVSESVDTLKLELAAKAAGGAVLYAGLLAIIGGCTLLLSMLMPLWASALCIGAALCICGGLLLKRKIELPKPDARELIPERTVSSLKQDVNTIKEAGRDATS